ncbi:hypothetical protein [Pseudobacillus wudalianchiensis]|uniref:YneQ n=1 Tax=Pseudobacillus wudalianchiensis TaxID=1743143 RepID=A0A1B9B7C1_9BACI|nr:hypothetical protein [Bacillus wudalianchiensis]OCA91978.1 hypothetical protein A8F95_18905 [Bacillus wudalianchiensis]
MAFGIDRRELAEWKQQIDKGNIAFLTHYWLDERFPDCYTVTKVGCRDLEKLARWGEKYGLKEEWIDRRKGGYSHFDLLGRRQKEILEKEGLQSHIQRFKL